MGVKAFNFKKRLLFVCLSMVLAFSIIVGALFYWQIIAADKLQRKAVGQWTTTTTVSASRGIIYDATGEVLAISASSKSLYTNPSKIAKSMLSSADYGGSDNKPREDAAHQLASRLAELLGDDYSEETLYKKIYYDKDNPITEYITARHLQPDQVEFIEMLTNESKINGLKLVDDVKRYYPKGATLAQTLGRTTEDGVGSDGLELKYDKLLRGLSGKLISSTDVSGGQIPGSEQRYIDATNGVNLHLTVDFAIQSFAEGVMRRCLEENQAEAVHCIVMEPKTGKVLAMVNLPDYDPNSVTRATLRQFGRNGCVLDTYEPGSTFKMFTVSAALDAGTVSTSSTFECPGYKVVDGETIKCWRAVPHGTQTLQEALCNSCNPAFMTVGLGLGQEKLYDYLYAFGFNTPTGIDFSADQSGILMAPKYVRNTDLARISFGQTIAVTPLQLITAACAVINGGTLYQPYLVDHMTNDEGQVLTQNEPIALGNPISEQTSAAMRTLLEGVVSEGGGKNAYLEGYRVGGKTGTAQKYRDGQILRGVHIGSFFGFAPADDPQIAILVTVDEAKIGNDYGSNTAAPYAGEILEKILQYKQVPRSGEEDETVTVPGVMGYTVENAAAILKESGLVMELNGSGMVAAQSPVNGTVVKKHSIVKITGTQQEDDTECYGLD